MSGNKTSNYLISQKQNAFEKCPDAFAGKLRSNYHKSKYLIYDNGDNIERNPGLSMDQVRCELGAVLFNIDPQNSKVRDFSVALPSVESDGQPTQFRQLKKEDSIIAKLEDDQSELVEFENMKPTWSQKKKCYVLKFSDRIKKSSVKNFQLVKKGRSRDDNPEVFLEFGKMGSNEFTLSLKHPFSIMNAFAIALAMFDK